MKENKRNFCPAIRFRRFANSSYAVFSSLKRPVNIGVLTVAMLTYANPETVSAQTENKTQEKLCSLEEIEVTGSRVPSTVSQLARIVTVLDREAIAAAPVQSVNDLLKYAVGVDVRQRGGLGVQTDISIRGGTFDQITILLNGINICDPQTGHNAADFPVELSEIERIEVLEGPAGRVYGTSSLVGAINIVTRIADRNNVQVHLDGGSYGYFNVGGQLNLNTSRVKNQVSGSYVRSDGNSRSKSGSLNADLRQRKFFYQGNYQEQHVRVRWHLGFSDKDYGANTFYSTASDEQFEHVRKWYMAIQSEAERGCFHFMPSIYWNRSEDRFEFFRGNAEKSPFNHHRTDVYGVNLNSYVQTVIGKTAFGAEMRNEGVISTTLGEPLNAPRPVPKYGVDYSYGLNRTNISFHLEHTVVLSPVTVSAGVVAVKNTGNEMNFRFYPGVDISCQLARDWKLYVSYNTSLRMPTFTELYYSVGGHKADKFLKPEEMQSFELGLKYLTPGVRATLSGYHYRGKNMIDWIKDVSQGEDAPWVSLNHTRINSTGVEAAFQVNFRNWFGARSFVRGVNVSYNFLTQDKETTPDIQSKYALEYLRHKLVAQADFHIWRNLDLQAVYRWQDRTGNYQKGERLLSYAPYSLLDARLSWNDRLYAVYVETNNILNKTYYDYGNIPQEGAWVRAGVRFSLDW